MPTAIAFSRKHFANFRIFRSILHAAESVLPKKTDKKRLVSEFPKNAVKFLKITF